jgi:hypothetical protein
MSNAHSTDSNNNNEHAPRIMELTDVMKTKDNIGFIMLVTTTSHNSDYMKKYDRVETTIVKGKYMFTQALAKAMNEYRYRPNDSVVKFRFTAYDKDMCTNYTIHRLNDFMSCVALELSQFLHEYGNYGEDGVRSSWSDTVGRDAWLSFYGAVTHVQYHNNSVIEFDGWSQKQKPIEDNNEGM